MTTFGIGLLLLVVAIFLGQQVQRHGRPLGPEGFQSKQNPYNLAGPDLYQTFAFRLGKQRLIDDVVNSSFHY